LATGPLAEWASSGIAPRPVLTPEIAPKAESEPAVAEEETPVSIPKSKQTRTGNFNQLSRKKRQPEHVPQAAEEDLQSWFWRWKWALLVGFFVITLLSMGAFVLFVSLSDRRDHFGSDNSNNDLGLPRSSESSLPWPKSGIPSTVEPTKPEETFYDSEQAKKNNTNSANATALKSPKSPSEGKQLTASTNSIQTSAPPQSTISPTQSAPKYNSNVVQTTNNATATATVLPIAKNLNLPDAFPKGDVFIIVKDKAFIGDLTLSHDLSAVLSKLCATDTPFSLVRSTSPGTSSPPVGPFKPIRDGEGTFKLQTDKSRSGFLVINGNKLSFQSTDPDETYIVVFEDNDKTVSLLISDQNSLSSRLTLPRSLLDKEPQDKPTSILLSDPLKKLISSWHVANPEGEDYSLSLQITSGRSIKFISDDPFSQSWKESVDEAAGQLQDARSTEDKLKTPKSQSDKLEKISFPDVNSSTLTLSPGTLSMSGFLSQADPKDKDPLLIQYAKAVVQSLSCGYSNDIKFTCIPDPDKQSPASWKKWLGDQEGAVTAQTKSQSKDLPQSQQDSLNKSVAAFQKDWEQNFITNSDLADLLSIASSSIPSVQNVAAQWQAAEQTIKSVDANSHFDLKDIDSIAIIGTSNKPANTVSLIVFKD
jgi:hypothetical protein